MIAQLEICYVKPWNDEGMPGAQVGEAEQSLLGEPR